MPLNIGIGTVPTPGDVFNAVEATLGNVVEGVIEGATGNQVELTPGNGVDNTTVSTPDGRSGNLKFNEKMATHADVERMRKELERKLGELKREHTKDKLAWKSEIARLKSQLSDDVGQYGPGGLVPYPRPSGGMDPMMLLLLTQASGNSSLASNPLLLMMLMQNMSSMQVGRVGRGGAVSVDMGQLLMLQLVMNTMNKAARSTPTTAAPAGGGPN